ncbi:lebercilin isoform X2 [Phyllopteryx taeniolatus]|uniref:lebercilin isoform X2 n=1 Tax=Phyllopteryx taeniolatus TaxID=161469 RepID=UPI002AD23E1B|nr:lebercilin isoform X2 [Phyllopteryx taeniolatus]
MESKWDASEDDWDDDRSRRSIGSAKSRASSAKKPKRYKNLRDRIQVPEKDVSKSQDYATDPDRDRDRDRASDGEGRRSKGTCYSDDYDNDDDDDDDESERSLSPYVRDRAPSPPARASRFSSASPYNTGLEKRVRARPPPPPRPGRGRAARSRSKDSLPPKDLDPLTRQMLSGRLLKINELRNVHAELQLRIVELQKENRILKQLQTRQEKALQNYTDAESKISQMLSCHANETHVLRERLRRARERERAAERRLKEKDEQLLRSHDAAGRMKKLLERRQLGERQELSCQLDQETARTHEAQLKIKELERNLELSNGGHQRQLAAERKKTLGAQEDIKSLQKELEQLANKLREKERELETRNIYAHRMGKVSPRKVTDGDTKSRLFSRTHSKAVQTHGRGGSPDFPSPPPALAEYSDSAPDGYLSLKQVDEVDGGPRPKREQQETTSGDATGSSGEGKRTDEERQRRTRRVLEAEADVFGDDLRKEEQEHDTGSLLTNQTGESVPVLEEADRRRNCSEARRRKDQLLAKMREIDLQNEDSQDPVFVDSSESNAPETPSPGGPGRRSLRSLKVEDDPVFGSYVSSFGNPRQSAAGEDGDRALEAIGVFSLKRAEAEEKNKKSTLMRQLFGSLAAASGDARKTEPDYSTGGNEARGGSRAAGRLGARHVADSRPAVRAVASFDDDIEELTL